MALSTYLNSNGTVLTLELLSYYLDTRLNQFCIVNIISLLLQLCSSRHFYKELLIT